MYVYSFHLLQSINDNDILRRVLQAVTRNGWSLLAVFGLMLKVIYIYALLAFAYMRDTFDPEEGMQCEYIWQCLATSVRAGLMSGGGLGEALSYAGIRSVPLFGTDTDMVVSDLLRIVFDLSFFILVTTIGLNVVFGIIIDTFSELREEKSEVDEAIKTKCYICGFQDFEFERNDSENGGWSNHREKDHNIWNYLMFINHVAVQNPTDYTYMESKVAEQLMDKSADWMPIGRALGLQGKVGVDGGNSNDEGGAEDGMTTDGGVGAGDGASAAHGGGAEGGANAASAKAGDELHSKLDKLTKTMGGQHASLQAVHEHVSTLIGHVQPAGGDGVGGGGGSGSGSDRSDGGGAVAFNSKRLDALETAVASQQVATTAMGTKLDAVGEKLDILTALLRANASRTNADTTTEPPLNATLVVPAVQPPAFQVRAASASAAAWADVRKPIARRGSNVFEMNDTNAP